MPATSKAQQRFMGLVKSYQDGDVPASKVSKAVKDAAKSMGEKEVDKYASTKHKGLPNKKEQLETLLRENPAAMAAVQQMTAVQLPGKNKPIKATTALKDKTQPSHKKAKSLFSKLYAKFSKKKKEKPKKQSDKDAEFYKKQFGRSGRELEKESVNERDNVGMAYKRTLAKVELKKIKDAILMFQKRIKKQGRVTNARDEDHLKNLIKVYKQMGGKGVKESVNENLMSFYKYIGDFYGKKGIYPDKKGRDLKVGDINKALSVYLKKYAKDEFTGDSLDRERVRDILIKMKKIDPQYKKQEVKESVEDKLRKIIKEEVREVINEGTRWLVGIEGNNGKILSTYGHYDGYPEWAGKHLKKFYNNPAKAKELLKLGKSGISTIGPKIKGNKDHSFEKPNKGVTVFYGRDRGEKSRMTSNWKNRDAVKFESGEEYAYIYNLKEKQWYYKSRYSNPQDWTPLK